ncbi:MAG: mechanosensitive ion channel family protein [Bdellovibrionales bacterium]|nr:mechanosensitive ion channel family protein [Bdellovibrionales bacterium]
MVLSRARHYLPAAGLALALALPVFGAEAPVPVGLASLPVNPLEPLRTESPKDTLRSFLAAMARYRQAAPRNRAGATGHLDRAARTLDLSEVPALFRDEAAREAALLLKEVIDRVGGLEGFGAPGEDAAKGLLRWRIPGTEITLVRIEQGERAGEFLFSRDTVARSKEFYQKVRALPYVQGSAGGAGYVEPWLNLELPDWARRTLVLVPNWKWLAIVAGYVAGLLVRYLLSVLLRAVLGLFARFGRLSQGIELGRVLARPAGWAAAGFLWLVALHALQFEGPVLTALTFLVQAHLSVVAVWSVYLVLDRLMAAAVQRAHRTQNALDDQLMPLLRKVVRILTILVGSLVAFQNLGFNVMSVVAGLGLGGLAFALAAQDTVANLFGSAMIFLDQPFRVGDWVKIGGAEGVVEEIGFRSTRIRTPHDSLLTVPNKAMADAEVDNLGRRQFRRVDLRLGLSYATKPAQIEAFVEGLRKVIAMHPSTRKEEYHVAFDAFADSALEVAVSFFLKVDTRMDELRVRQELFLEFVRLADKQGVSFAFPTRTVHVESLPK